MRARFAHARLVLATLLPCASTTAGGLDQCIELTAMPDGSARLTNVCGSRLNIVYCIDHPDSPKTCASAALPVTTLFPSAHESVASYAGGALRTAVCVYPEAPSGWQAGVDSAYTCKKTCVMC